MTMTTNTVRGPNQKEDDPHVRGPSLQHTISRSKRRTERMMNSKLASPAYVPPHRRQQDNNRRRSEDTPKIMPRNNSRRGPSSRNDPQSRHSLPPPNLWPPSNPKPTCTSALSATAAAWTPKPNPRQSPISDHHRIQPPSYRIPSSPCSRHDSNRQQPSTPKYSSIMETPNHRRQQSYNASEREKPHLESRAREQDGIDVAPASLHQGKAMEAASLFTRIACINLSRRQDRWRTFQQRMRMSLIDRDDNDVYPNHHPFAEKVEQFSAVDGNDVMHRYADEDAEDNFDSTELPNLIWDATTNAKYDKHIQPPFEKVMTPGEVGCAMSHIRLWKELVDIIIRQETNMRRADENIEGPTNIASDTKPATMLILEDDAILYKAGRKPKRGKNRRHTFHSRTSNSCKSRRKGRYSDAFALNGSRRNLSESFNDASLKYDEGNEPNNGGFVQALLDIWEMLPEDWDVVYFGMSDRGERQYIAPTAEPRGGDNVGTYGESSADQGPAIPVTLFRPTYGFHTHAYALTQRAASVLLSNLPVAGPLDVWLADNQWFGLDVYCASVDDGSGFNGGPAQLIAQQRHRTKSDIGMSGRVSL